MDTLCLRHIIHHHQEINVKAKEHEKSRNIVQVVCGCIFYLNCKIKVIPKLMLGLRKLQYYCLYKTKLMFLQNLFTIHPTFPQVSTLQYFRTFLQFSIPSYSFQCSIVARQVLSANSTVQCMNHCKQLKYI